MATPAHRINALLDVFDRADQMEAQTREQLVATAQALDPQRDPAVLAAAVDAHLTEQESAAPLVVLKSATPFSFPWKRPKDSAEQQTRTRWLRWMDAAAADVDYRMKLLVRFFLGGLFIGGPIATALLYFPHQTNEGPFWLACLLGAMEGSMFGGIAFISLLLLYSLKRFPHLPFADALPREESQYLQHADTRTYLIAVLSSAIPTLLGGDVRELETMMMAHDHVKEKAQEKAAKEEAAKQRSITAQQKADHLAQRDKRLAKMLTQDIEP